MPAYERINAVVSLTLIGLALYFVLDFPRQITTLMLFGSPLEVDSPRQWLMALLLGGLAMAGSDAVMRTHAELPSRRLSYLATFWTLPGLLVILAMGRVYRRMLKSLYFPGTTWKTAATAHLKRHWRCCVPIIQKID